jgi:ADP-heptose:LPS heptosyltransferase
MSLAGALGVTLANVPAEGSYLRAPEDRLTPWATRLSRSDDRLKVAIACSGRPTHKHEQRRSIQLADFAEIGERAHLFILQKELTGRDRVAIEEGRVKAEYLGDEIVDFRDGAAILANVDLVICIDTAIAHLAGALGRPTWLLLSKIPDWRWMLGRADTPWYPSLRLYRQEIAGDWGEVLASVRRDLERPHVGR